MVEKEQKVNLTFITLSILMLIPSIIRLIFRVTNFKGLLIEYVSQMGAVIFGAIAVFIVLYFQLNNPICSPKAFKVIYYIFFWVMLIFYILFFVNQLIVLFYTKEIVWPMYFIFGAIIALYIIKLKYMPKS